MEFAMSEWLTVIIVLLILGVLFDGWRRMRQSKRQSIKMSLSMNKGSESGAAESYGSELPNGGARVIGVRDEDNTRVLTRNLQDNFEQTKTTLKPREPEQATLNLDEEVPMLMDSVVEEGSERVEPSFNEAPENSPLQVEEPAAPLARSETVAPRQEPKASKPSAVTEEVLVINIMSSGDERFQGEALLDVILECGMRFGDMQIFHRHLDEDGDGPLLFSMANMVVPGTFDLNGMSEFETPGVSLFMTLPMPANSMDAFNLMADTAKAIAGRLNGELKDENRSVMTAQTIEHCRQRVRDFERKQLSKG